MTQNEIIKQLKDKGHRITNARKWIVGFLVQKHCPLSAQEIHDLLHKNKVQVNLSTVYRELQFLIAEKVIHDIYFRDGIERFELTEEEHHHHLVCKKCHKVTPFEMEDHLTETERSIKTAYKFTVQEHTLEFYGICSACR